MKNELDMLDIISVVSVILQLQNNAELRQQTSNDQVIENIHNDISALLNENRALCRHIIEQNDVILEMLKDAKSS